MSTLYTLFEEKLAALLPGASVACTQESSPLETDANQLVINLTQTANEHANLYVILPKETYADWNTQSLQLLAHQILRNCELTLALGHQEAMYEAYLQEVKTTKEKLLPHHSHQIEGVEYAIHYAPSIGGGGDYIDIVDLRAARRRAGFNNDDIFWGGSLFDVSGHGPGAAVEVAMIDAILRTYKGAPGGGPGDVMTYVNKHFFTRQRRGGFVTGLLCTFNATEQLFSYANAGHLAPIIRRKNGQIELLDTHGGIPIGIEQDTTWETQSIAMYSGDTIVMLTDGVTEARSIENSEFGYEKVVELVNSHGMDSPDAFMKSFTTTFSEHIKDQDIQDDQTLIVIQLLH
jgi:phosphoserine phosphatase RsbU/P